MNEREDAHPMTPVHADDVRASKPWWVSAHSRGVALFQSFFYLVFGCLWLVGQGILRDQWWNILIGAVWLLLDVAAWATVWWFSRQPPEPTNKADNDGGAS